MILFNKFKKVLGNQAGQIMVEFAFSIPVLFLCSSAAIDYVGMARMQHQIVAAAYEATKVIPQLSGPYTLICGTQGESLQNTQRTTPDVPSACGIMIRRAQETLANSGLDPSKAKSISVVLQLVDRNGKPGKEFLAAGVNIQYAYIHTFANLLSLSQQILKTTSYTVVAPVTGNVPNDAYVAANICVMDKGILTCP